MKQPPLLLCSDLTSTVYVVTRYKVLDDGVIEAIEKHDVTDQFVSVAFGLSEDWWNEKADAKAPADTNLSRSNVSSGQEALMDPTVGPDCS